MNQIGMIKCMILAKQLIRQLIKASGKIKVIILNEVIVNARHINEYSNRSENAKQ